MTPTAGTPPTRSVPGPGTVISNENVPPPPTILAPSYMPNVRSGSMTRRFRSIESSLRSSPKAVQIASNHSRCWSGGTVRTSSVTIRLVDRDRFAAVVVDRVRPVFVEPVDPRIEKAAHCEQVLAPRGAHVSPRLGGHDNAHHLARPLERALPDLDQAEPPFEVVHPTAIGAVPLAVHCVHLPP